MIYNNMRHINKAERKGTTLSIRVSEDSLKEIDRVAEILNVSNRSEAVRFLIVLSTSFLDKKFKLEDADIMVATLEKITGIKLPDMP